MSFIDGDGKRQKIERQAESQKQAQQHLIEIIKDLSSRQGIAVQSKRIHERRGGIFARVTFVDDSGERRAKNRSDAKEIIKGLLRDFDDHGESLIDAARMTFNELADYYAKNYLIEPEYVDGRKVAGLRSVYSMRIRLSILKSYFGKSKVRAITHGDLKRFKAERLKTPTQPGFYAVVVITDDRRSRHEVRRKAQSREQAETILGDLTGQLLARRRVSIIERRIEAKPGGQRSITTVNRELQLLRRMLNVAASNGWLKRNPFAMGDALITLGDEKKRERILDRDEEERLLAACTGKRAHLRPILICALDTGMRRGEMLKLVASDLDFNNRVITVRAFNTKTMRERQVAMTDRLARELLALIADLPASDGAPLFGITTDFKKAFHAARAAAGLADVRFHDLRHTHATRLVGAHMPLSEVGRVLGHTQANTTFRYVNANVETARRAAALIDEFNSQVSVDEGDKPLIN